MALVDEALKYAKLGWGVIPVEGKETGLALSKYKPSLNPTEIKQWFISSNLNVAIKTGLDSKLIVLDIDPRNGGFSSLATMEAQHGRLPITPKVRSGGGGLHYYFRHPPFEVRGRIGMKPGVDVKAYGGGMIAPPSKHPNGALYKWEIPYDTEVAIIPQWLLTLIMTKQHKLTPEIKKHVVTSPYFEKYKNKYKGRYR